MFRKASAIWLMAMLLATLAALPAATAAAGVITFNFSAYGNPERPFPGYVGPWQLGPVTISGSGQIRDTDGALLSGGVIKHSDNLKDPRYPNHSTTWQVVRMIGIQSTGARTVMTLQVRVVASNYPYICPLGTYGVVTLIADKSLMANGQTNDGVGTQMPNPFSRAPDGGGACRTHTHGMNNTTTPWTDPPFGGLQGGVRGGMWAIVNIGRGPSGGILGRWIRRRDQSIVEFTAEGNTIVGHIIGLGPTLGRYGFQAGEETFVITSASGDVYSGQVEWRNFGGRRWWQATRQTVVGDEMHGDVGDWVRLNASAAAPRLTPPGHQSGGMIVDPPQ